MEDLVITTGGTIGALPYVDPSRTPKNAKMPNIDLIKKTLEAMGFFNVISFPPVDSKAMTIKYREELLNEIKGRPEQKIIVTHGTDTIVDTAYFFKNNLPNIPNKMIILTGAMTPLSNGPDSDGYNNLQFSLCQKYKPGVYIAMPNKVRGAPVLIDCSCGEIKKVYCSDGRDHYFEFIKNKANIVLGKR